MKIALCIKTKQLKNTPKMLTKAEQNWSAIKNRKDQDPHNVLRGLCALNNKPKETNC